MATVAVPFMADKSAIAAKLTIGCETGNDRPNRTRTRMGFPSRFGVVDPKQSENGRAGRMRPINPEVGSVSSLTNLVQPDAVSTSKLIPFRPIPLAVIVVPSDNSDERPS